MSSPFYYWRPMEYPLWALFGTPGSTEVSWGPVVGWHRFSINDKTSHEFRPAVGTGVALTYPGDGYMIAFSATQPSHDEIVEFSRQLADSS